MAHRTIPPPDLEHDPLDPPSPAGPSPLGSFAMARVGTLPRPNRSWAVAALAVALAVAAGWWLLRPSAQPIESALPMAARPQAPAAGTGGSSAGSSAGSGSPLGGSSSTAVAADLVVQAAGQVNRPGVYHLPVDARVDDLVRQAGGFTTRADGDRVNLAAPLADGERVWVPATGEDRPPEVVAGGGGGGSGGGPASSGSLGSTGSGSGGAAAPASPVDLNSATADELDALPGVGPATAAAILAYRDQHGRFGSVDDLLDVRGIGDAKLEQLRPLVRV